MFKSIFITSVLLATSTLALASVCDNSTVTVKNETGETLILGNVISANIYYQASGLTTAESGTRISPNESYQFFVSSTSGTNGDASIYFTVEGDNGASDFYPYLKASGIFNKSCVPHSFSHSQNLKSYMIVESMTTANPASIEYTIKSPA